MPATEERSQAIHSALKAAGVRQAPAGFVHLFADLFELEQFVDRAKAFAYFAEESAIVGVFPDGLMVIDVGEKGREEISASATLVPFDRVELELETRYLYQGAAFGRGFDAETIMTIRCPSRDGTVRDLRLRLVLREQSRNSIGPA